jgi:S1-C subfamily serine protease
MMRAGFIAVLAAVAVGGLSAAALAQQDLSTHGTAKTVRISYKYTDPNTGQIGEATGSGVIITNRGYVITAYHVVAPWLRQPDTEKDKNQLKVTIGSKFGTQYQLLGPDSIDHDSGDFAIFRIADPPPPGGFSSATMCFEEFGDVPGKTFMAFGFPLGYDIQPVDGRLGNDNGPKLSWMASTSFAEGMSGGPVFDNNGLLIGLIRSGEKPPAQFVTPIWRARPAFLKSNIDGSKPPCPSALIGSSVTVASAPSVPSTASAPAAPPTPSEARNCRVESFRDVSRSRPYVEARTICY